MAYFLALSFWRTIVCMKSIFSGLSVDEQFHHDCHLLDTLAEGGAPHQAEKMFTTEPKLLPPDIIRHLDSVKQQQGQR